jgi:hypothetical protein
MGETERGLPALETVGGGQAEGEGHLGVLGRKDQAHEGGGGKTKDYGNSWGQGGFRTIRPGPGAH